MNEVSTSVADVEQMAVSAPGLEMRLTVCRDATGDDAAFGFDIFTALAEQFLTVTVDPRIDVFRQIATAKGVITRASIQCALEGIRGEAPPFDVTFEEGCLILSIVRIVELPANTKRTTVSLSVSASSQLTVVLLGCAKALATVASLKGPPSELITRRCWPIFVFIPIGPGGRKVTIEPALTDFAGAFKCRFDEARFTDSKRHHG